MTSPGLLFRALRARQGAHARVRAASPGSSSGVPRGPGHAAGHRADGHPHTLSFLATVNQVPHAALGVSQFGQSGSIEDLYRYNGIDTDSIIRAALDLLP